MNTFELKEYLDKNNFHRRGVVMIVCAIDQLPKKINKNREYGIVINLSRSSEAGSHWTSLYVDRKQNATYCDSFGFRPRGYHIDKFVKENCKTFSYNKHQFQQLNTKGCGMYATLFILNMMHGGTLKTFASQFSKNNLVLNDIIIQNKYLLNKKN